MCPAKLPSTRFPQSALWWFHFHEMGHMVCQEHWPPLIGPFLPRRYTVSWFHSLLKRNARFFIYPCKVTLHSMAYFEAAYHYNKRHNALEDAAWIDLFVRKFAHVAACYVRNFNHLTLVIFAPSKCRKGSTGSGAL